MKKFLSIIVICIFLVCAFSSVVQAAFGVSTKVTPTQIKIGDTVTYTITTNENVIATNFEISYANDKFELIGSDTSNLSVSKKNNKIACIYADMSGVGTKEFKIKFKAIAETSNATFSISDYKFRVPDNDNSYTNLSIANVNNISVTNGASSGLTIKEPSSNTANEPIIGSTEGNKNTDTTLATATQLPQTGKTETIAFITILLAITTIGLIFKFKSDELSKILRG